MHNNFSKEIFSATFGTAIYAFLQIGMVEDPYQHNPKNILKNTPTIDSNTSHILLAPLIIASYAFGTISGGLYWAFVCGISTFKPDKNTRPAKNTCDASTYIESANKSNDIPNFSTKLTTTIKHASRIPFLPLAAIAVAIGWLVSLCQRAGKQESQDTAVQHKSGMGSIEHA